MGHHRMSTKCSAAVPSRLGRDMLSGQHESLSHLDRGETNSQHSSVLFSFLASGTLKRTSRPIPSMPWRRCYLSANHNPLELTRHLQHRRVTKRTQSQQTNIRRKQNSPNKRNRSVQSRSSVTIHSLRTSELPCICAGKYSRSVVSPQS